MSDQVKAAEELRSRVEGQRFVMLATSNGAEISNRPMTVQEFDGWTLRFITQASNEVVAEGDGKRVNVGIMDGGTFVSLTGTGSINRSVEDKRELWGRLNEAYAGEPEDPENVILDITVTEGEYWDGGNPVARLVGLATAALTGKAPEGDHGTATV